MTAKTPATKQSICLFCHAPVDWRYSGALYEKFDAGTTTPHRCEGEASDGE